jgi:5-deoxy-glucuronate isomerase
MFGMIGAIILIQDVSKALRHDDPARGKWLDFATGTHASCLAGEALRRLMRSRTITTTSRRLLYRTAPRAPRSGAVLDLTPRALGWTSLHFGVRRLAAGAAWTDRCLDAERCLVLLRGRFEVRWDRQVHEVGPRADVFDGYPHAVYLPAGCPVRIRASEACEIADCRARLPGRLAREAFDARIIRPADCGYEIRGGGNATRQIVDIMPPGFPAARLLVCEVFTPGGNWSSYPPHKHDVDDPPREADLDEIYYYRFRSPGGYGFQRLYTRGSDETLRVTHGDVVAVREGYHPFVTAYGYDAYYLNALAGSRRSMAASDDPDHARFRHDWPAPDPRLPMVPPPSGLPRDSQRTR